MVAILLGTLFWSNAFAQAQTPTSGACSIAIPANQGRVTSTITVSQQSPYSIWVRTMKTSSGSSFILQIDNQCPFLINLTSASTSWAWSQTSSGTSLPSGTHTIVLAGNGEGVRIDRILFTTDGCTPSGNGDNCIATPPNCPRKSEGDVSCDGVISIFDLSVILGNFGTTTASADVNGDNTVNIFDLSIVLAHFGS